MRNENGLLPFRQEFGSHFNQNLETIFGFVYCKRSTEENIDTVTFHLQKSATICYAENQFVSNKIWCRSVGLGIY